jgi:hypothetical protein
MAGEHWLDWLGRELARGTSRKAFLRALGVGLVGALAPVAPGTARAQQGQRCRDGCTESLPDCCNGFCVNLLVSESHCRVCDRACAAGQICDQGECVTPGPPGGQCEPACGPDELCIGPLGERRCCHRDRMCRGVCHAEPPKRCGGDVCCPPDESCCGSGCCGVGTNCCEGQGCCQSEQTCCAGACCDPGQTCLPTSPFREPPYPCCPDDQVCGVACCGPSRDCVDGRCLSRCSPACQPGEVCIPVPDLELGTRNSCCPAENAWDLLNDGVWVNTVCCPPEQRWEHPQGYITEAECCPPEDRWLLPWRDTFVGQCCPAARRCGEKCCPDELPRCEDGVCKPEAPVATTPPWLQPDPACTPRRASIYITGLITDMSAGIAVCDRTVIVCADSFKVTRRYNYSKGERCPWAPGARASITMNYPGALVCCEKWQEAKRTGSPCNPLEDADCDGVPNSEDEDTLEAEGGPPVG